MSPPRVIVVEDDETLGEFFSMVLDTMPVSALVCRSAEEALQALTQEPADVLVTDLLLPGMDGRGLLQEIRREGRLRGAARLVVMSGSVDDATRREMTQLGVWQVLCKPVTVKAFKACIEGALAGPAPSPGPLAGGSAVQAAAPEVAGAISDRERAVIDSLFAGQEALFLAYRGASLQQFPRDIEQGDLALNRQDVPGLRRVAHNLKSVLKTLGHEALSDSAKQLEDDAARWLESHRGGLPPGQTPWAVGADLEQGWVALKAGLRSLSPPANA